MKKHYKETRNFTVQGKVVVVYGRKCMSGVWGLHTRKLYNTENTQVPSSSEVVGRVTAVNIIVWLKHSNTTISRSRYM